MQWAIHIISKLYMLQICYGKQKEAKEATKEATKEACVAGVELASKWWVAEETGQTNDVGFYFQGGDQSDVSKVSPLLKGDM